MAGESSGILCNALKVNLQISIIERVRTIENAGVDNYTFTHITRETTRMLEEFKKVGLPPLLCDSKCQNNTFPLAASRKRDCNKSMSALMLKPWSASNCRASLCIT